MNRPRTRSIHTRLFLGYAAALVTAVAVMALAVYIGMRYLPSYSFGNGYVPSRPVTAPTPSPGFTTEPVQGHAKTISVSSPQDVWTTVLVISLVAAAVVAGLGLLFGRGLVRRLLKPLDAITTAAARAGDGDLGQRIDTGGQDDELGRLAVTFNTTLERLERSFDAHRRFAANASHELLTPLATTRTTLQVAMADPTGQELTRLAPILVASNERSIETVTALLQLAGAEHAPWDPEPVDLGELVTAACHEHSERAQDLGLGIETDLEPRLAVRGNAALLRQLVGNLLDNALVHNVPGGHVHIAVYQGDDGDPCLEVCNSGPAVDPAGVERLFEPFHRARGRTGRGHGLGLAIVEAVARAHRSEATATANPDGGLTVRVAFPGTPVGPAQP